MEKNQNKLQLWFLRRPLTAFLASNLLAQFSRQIVVQILGMAFENTMFSLIPKENATVSMVLFWNGAPDHTISLNWRAISKQNLLI
jgi:hypothetical protein